MNTTLQGGTLTLGAQPHEIQKRDTERWKRTEQENNILYKQVLEHKCSEFSKEGGVAQESHGFITAMMMTDRRKTSNKKGGSLSKHQYVESDSFKRVNTGGNPKIDVSHCIHPLSPDECDVYESLVDAHDSCKIVVMPNHHISTSGVVEGYKFTCDRGISANVLPIGREMFFRHSIVECIKSTQTAEMHNEDHDILKMLLDQGSIRKKLVEVVRKLQEDAKGMEPSFDCMPEGDDNLDTTRGVTNWFASTSATQRTCDSRDWNPEPPQMVGLFHAYTKGMNKDERYHKLFIVVSGGCTSVSDRLYNITMDVKDHITCSDYVDSEEMWYLNRISQRNNAKILHKVATAFNLNTPCMYDAQSYHENSETVACTTETIYCLVQKEGNGNVTVYSRCADPRTCHNGVACTMHPSEGVWLFKGPAVTKQIAQPYGGPFGHNETSGPSSFPTTAVRIDETYHFSSQSPKNAVMEGKAMSRVCSKDSEVITRIDSSGNILDPQESMYTYIDETYMKSLAGLQWNRDWGLIELVPIAIVITEW